MTARHDNRGDAVPAAIALFRTIAASSGDALATEGPVHADHRLLGLCADALHHLTLAEAIVAEHRREMDTLWCGWSEAEKDAWRARCSALTEAAKRHNRAAAPLLRAITRIRATTPAGIYGKAMACKASRTGAAVLAKSLAEDLVASAALRAVLWPADAPEADRDAVTVTR